MIQAITSSVSAALDIIISNLFEEFIFHAEM
jgi:hypothetical protein